MIVERFFFYSMQERTPPKGVPVLVKFDDYERLHKVPNYYVCYYLPGDPQIHRDGLFCEAGGEEYWTFDPAHVVGWASIGMEQI